MTISKWTAAGGLAIPLFVGLIIGRYTMPKRVIERDRIVTIDSEKEARSEAYVGRGEIVTKREVVYNTRTEWRSDGTVVAITEAASTDDAREATVVEKTVIEVREVVKYVDKETIKIVESPRKDWLITGRVGAHFERPSFDDWIYGASVQRRILGPFHAGAWLQGSGWSVEDAAGGVAVSVVW